MSQDLITDAADRSPGARVTAHIRRAVREGRYQAGQKLPSENKLAQEVGVARGTVRLALQRLEEEGLIRGTGRRGRFISPAASVGLSLMSHTIGVLSYLELEPDSSVMMGSMLAVQAGMGAEARASGCHVLMLHPDRLQADGLARLLSDRPRGIAVTHHVIESEQGLAMVARLQDAGVAVVVNGEGEPVARFDTVESDHERGAYELANWLIARGRRRIIRLSAAGPHIPWGRARDAGYERAMREAGLEVLPPIQLSNLEYPGAAGDEVTDMRARLMAGYLAERFGASDLPDAAMLTTDSEVPSFARACRYFGLELGRDIIAVGYDAFWHEMEESRAQPQSLSATVDKQNHAIGVEMVRLLNRRVDGLLDDEPVHVLMPPHLVEYA